MNQETFLKLKKGNPQAKAVLCREYLNRTWFLCYQLTQDSRTAAPLLLSAWEKTFEEVAGFAETPAGGFRELVTANIFKVFQGGIQPDESFSALTKPQPAERFGFLVKEIQTVSDSYRSIYLMNIYGGLSKNSIAEITGLKPESISEAIQKALEEISVKRPKTTQQEWAAQMRLSAEFRSPTEEGFAEIVLPPRLAGAAEEQFGIRISEANPKKQKRGKAMPALIKKARKGNPESLKTLYGANKGHILSLCQGLLGCTPDSETVMLQVFKRSWGLLLDGKIDSEDEFSAALESKAISVCKNRTQRKNSRAFNLPPNGNFAATAYRPDKMCTDGKPVDVILGSLPDLHRFIYVLRTLTGMSDKEIGRLLNMSTENVYNAVNAEDANLNRISMAVQEQRGEDFSISTEEFHASLVKKEEQVVVSNGGNKAAEAAIQSLCKPIWAKARKRTIRAAAVIAGIILAVGITAGIALMDGTDSEEDNLVSSSIGESVSNEDISSLADESSADEAMEDNIAVIESPTHYADISIRDYGTVTVALDGNTAPKTVENFVALAESGFYNGLTFHRIIDGFMMQGGDPNGDGSGGSDATITGEFSENGVENSLSHTRGAIAMARSDDYDSASSQFFIVHKDSTYLDGSYAVFGYVTSGMDIVDSICSSAEPTDDNGTIPSEQQPVIESITIRSPAESGDDEADHTSEPNSDIENTSSAA